MWALIVAVALMLNGSIMEDKLTYNGAAWATEQECKDFVNSGAGKASLADLKTYLMSVSGDLEPKMDPVCTKIEGTQ